MEVRLTSSPGMTSQLFCHLLLAIHLCFVRLASGQLNQTSLYVANFNMNGASGQVSFVGPSPGPVTIRVDLVGLESGNYTWAVHEKPMVYGQQPACDAALIGGVFTADLFAPPNATTIRVSGNWTGSYTNDIISLVGPQSIMGRTLVLQEESSLTRYCARIANSRKSVTAVARFDEPFAGKVTLRQEKGNPDAETSIFVELYDVTAPITQATYSWRISSNSGYNYDMDLNTLCQETSDDVYNPTATDVTSCARDDPTSCPIGHLGGKFDDVVVDPVPSASTYYFIDTNLPLSGDNSVLGKSLVFSEGSGNPVACSPILELKPKSVKALFSVKNVSGTIHFSQESPYDVTEIRINLRNLRGLAGGYHVHSLPPPPRTYAGDEPAGAQNVAGHFDPYNIGSAPPAGEGTNDQYEVGDLSGKFGLLTGRDNFNATYEDWNLPLFGRNSIVGRSIVIHKVEGNRWLYAAIVYPTKKKTVRADFKAPSVGQIILSQDVDDPYADTTIYVELAYADGSATTTGHNWHVHQTAVSNDYITAQGRCASSVGHFNPFAVLLGDTYGQCSPAYSQRCELGDLSRKHGQVTITGEMRVGAGKFFFTDARLPLSGAYSVAGRSVVIHEADGGSPRMSCANLLEIPATETSANLWSSGPVTGDITFKQDTVFDPVQIGVNVKGLGNLAGGWHVHLLPIADGTRDASPCSQLSVQGHYNPFGVTSSPPHGTLDMYEMGDLSGKFGSFAGTSDTDDVFYDTNLALSGPRSIIGRSLVVHKSLDGSRWVCSTLYRKTSEGDFIIRARADITATEYTGYMLLSQTRFNSGAMGDTTVEIGLSSNVAERDTLYWNFRPGRIDEGSCLASSPIFNPHQVAMDTDYRDQCDTRSQVRCAVGDLTGKHGNMSSTVQRAVYTDVNLPLAGQASVLGLPLHLTSTNTGRLACSTLEPDKNTGRVQYLQYPSTREFDPYQFRRAIEATMDSVDMWQVVVTEEPQVDGTTGCAALKFYFIGENLDEMQREFDQRLSSDDLGEYSPTTLCKGDTTGSSHCVVPTASFAILAVIVAHVVLLLLHRSP